MNLLSTLTSSVPELFSHDMIGAVVERVPLAGAMLPEIVLTLHCGAVLQKAR